MSIQCRKYVVFFYHSGTKTILILTMTQESISITQTIKLVQNSKKNFNKLNVSVIDLDYVKCSMIAVYNGNINNLASGMGGSRDRERKWEAKLDQVYCA